MKKIALSRGSQRFYQNKTNLKYRLADIDHKLESYSKQLEEFNNKKSMHLQEKTEEEAALEKRISEVREYFGYWIGNIE